MPKEVLLRQRDPSNMLKKKTHLIRDAIVAYLGRAKRASSPKIHLYVRRQGFILNGVRKEEIGIQLNYLTKKGVILDLFKTNGNQVYCLNEEYVEDEENENDASM